jgi:hypothetical protein
MLATDQLFSVSHIAWNLITCRPFTNHLKYFTASQTTFTTDGSSASTIITHSCIPLDCNHQTLCFLQPFSRRCIVLEINKISLFQKKSCYSALYNWHTSNQDGPMLMGSWCSFQWGVIGSNVQVQPEIAKRLVQPGWANVDGLSVLFPMRCYWFVSDGVYIAQYRMAYQELKLFLNHIFPILLDTRIGPYRDISPYRTVSDTATAPILEYRWFISTIK